MQWLLSLSIAAEARPPDLAPVCFYADLVPLWLHEVPCPPEASIVPPALRPCASTWDDDVRRFEYDSSGRLVQVRWTLLGAEHRLERTLDASGRLLEQRSFEPAEVAALHERWLHEPGRSVLTRHNGTIEDTFVDGRHVGQLNALSGGSYASTYLWDGKRPVGIESRTAPDGPVVRRTSFEWERGGRLLWLRSENLTVAEGEFNRRVGTRLTWDEAGRLVQVDSLFDPGGPQEHVSSERLSYECP